MPTSEPPKHAAPRRTTAVRLLLAGIVVVLAAGTTAAIVVARDGSAGPAGGTPSAGTTGTSASGKPNIVLILTDDQRWDELGTMPTVDKQIVDKGTTFKNGFVVNPLCCPSRTTILTGKYSHSTGIYRNKPPHGGFPSFEPEEGSTIATWLHGAGYRTALVGKYLNHYTPQDASHIPPGWDDWKAEALSGTGEGGVGYYDYAISDNGKLVHYGHEPSDYSTTVLGHYATDFIRGAPASQPLFLYFATRAPHVPATAEPRYEHACAGLPPLRPPSYNEADVSDKPHYVQIIPPMSPETPAAGRRAPRSPLPDAAERRRPGPQHPEGPRGHRSPVEHADPVRVGQRPASSASTG